MTITDDQLRELTERPSLRERAKQAALRAARAETERLNDEYAELCRQARLFQHEVLGMTPGEMSEVEFKRSMHNQERPRCEFTVDGIRFRVRNRTKAVNITSNGERVSLGNELVPLVEFRAGTSGDYKELDADDADAKLAQIGFTMGG